MQNKLIGILISWNLLLYQGSCTALERISQHPANILYDYLSYRQISIIHFSVPENTIFAVFKFTAEEEKLGGIGKCSARDVSIFLKSGSIPLVRPDNSTISAKLLEDRRDYYSLKSMSDGVKLEVRMDAPLAGDWYAIAFRSWVDPESNKITQQGLEATCDTVLDAELLIEPVATQGTLAERDTVNLSAKQNNSALLQFYIRKGTDKVEVTLDSSCTNCTIYAYVTARDNLAKTNFNSSKTTMTFRPNENAIHNLLLRIHNGTESKITVSLKKYEPTNRTDLVKIDLIRRSLSDFFLFDYDHLMENDTKVSPVNLTAGTLSVLKFDIGPVYDVGGTITVGLKTVKDEAKVEKVIIVGCVSLGYYSNISSTLACERRQSKSVADVWVNSTEPSFVYIAYPEPGSWYLSIKAFCLEESCACAEECGRSLCRNCSCAKECSSQVETNVGSFACVNGQCNEHGRCMHYSSGGLVFSACECVVGYRGFDCADDAYVLDSGTVIKRLLLLSLSNLAFLGSLVLAVRRQYYTEAITYAAVMFFSTFYHACDSGDELHKFCIMRLSVLQFCDFYNALLSIWVTLVAMVSFGPRLTAFCQMAGAVLLAVGAELDRTALWVFLLPVLTGCILIGLSWARKCQAKGTYHYPARPYRLFYLPAGLSVVILGLICYAFLQTHSNYYIVHSFWHVCVAVGVMLLLPKRQYMDLGR